MSITLTHIARSGTDTVTLGGEPTEVAGLAVTPAVDPAGCYTGRWTVTHQASGRAVCFPGGMTLAHARQFAALLSGPDWTLDPATLYFLDGTSGTARRAAQRYQTAASERAPLWWSRWSWTRHAPRWAQHWAGEPELLTWPRVVATADDAAIERDSVEPEPVYDPRELHGLRCAAPGCVPVHLDDGEGGLLLSATKHVVRDEARRQGWVRHGPRWLCPACAHAHTDTAWL